MPVKVHLCGVRGSTPVSGREFDRFGGHTACVAVCQGEEKPRLILDAGTGLARAIPLFEGAPLRGTILLGHLHWDHTQGLPFFPPADNPDALAIARFNEEAAVAFFQDFTETADARCDHGDAERHRFQKDVRESLVPGWDEDFF